MRVLGTLWPLYRQGSDHASFRRPGRRNLFFIAQTPYIIQGTLREQVAWRWAGWAAALVDRANLTGLVLGCIEAKFCKKICV